MLVYVRHGATSLNKGGSGERLRGWLPVPLTATGEDQAKQAGMRLNKLLMVAPKTFETSDLPRAMQTASIIGRHMGLTATPNTNLRDWNTGTLAGQNVDDVLPQLKHLMDHPDEPAPGGEPLNAYLDRFDPAMREKIAAPGMHLVVGHARGASLLEGMASPVGGVGDKIDPAFLVPRSRVKPGGILIINKDWHTTVDNPPEKD